MRASRRTLKEEKLLQERQALRLLVTIRGLGCGSLNEKGEPDLHARSPAGLTPALETQSLSTFQILVGAGADPLARDNAGRSAFDLAIERWNDSMAVGLLEQHPALAPTGETLDTAFVEAVRHGCAGTAKKLIQMGADVGQRPGGRSLLQCAPAGADELRRLLRAIKTGAMIEAAMPGGDAPPTAGPGNLSPSL